MSTKLAAQFMGEMIGQQNRSRVSLKSKIHILYAHIVIWYLKSTMIIQKMSSTALNIIGTVPLGPEYIWNIFSYSLKKKTLCWTCKLPGLQVVTQVSRFDPRYRQLEKVVNLDENSWTPTKMIIKTSGWDDNPSSTYIQSCAK